MNESLPKMSRQAGAGVEAAGFFSAILSGLLLGLLGDAWLGTEPLLVVFGIIAGSATGFWKMWQVAKKQDDG
jgi:F0F1-type ATP synthase assembly protein I